MQQFTPYIERIDCFIANYFEDLKGCVHQPALQKLFDSMFYTTSAGGKRFRPLLSLLTAEALEVDMERVLPFGAAVEFVHSYSLIHDDLPLMDNDDVRRGQPTNHKIFGEQTALLAGDALLTESFLVLAKYFGNEPYLFSQLVRTLSLASGWMGMVGGQALDLSAQSAGRVTLENLFELHQLKTGVLIESAVVGAAWIANQSQSQRQLLKEFGGHLGLAFQIADDLLDFDPVEPESANFATLMGPERAKGLLNEISALAKSALHFLGGREKHLVSIVDYNQKRTL